MNIILLSLLLSIPSATTTSPVTDTMLQTIEAERRAMAIKYIETKDDTSCIHRGASGEYGCFQIMPSTLKGLAKKHHIEVKSFTYEVQKTLVIAEMKSQIIKGIKPEQTFKLWNSGNLKPCSKGVNRYGVKYDSCRYIKDAMNIYNSL